MYRILIIEDDFSLAEAMKKQIESWGNEVEMILSQSRLTLM